MSTIDGTLSSRDATTDRGMSSSFDRHTLPDLPVLLQTQPLLPFALFFLDLFSSPFFCSKLWSSYDLRLIDHIDVVMHCLGAVDDATRDSEDEVRTPSPAEMNFAAGSKSAPAPRARQTQFL